jgi:uncharacterized protein (TIRG00374 family)
LTGIILLVWLITKVDISQIWNGLQSVGWKVLFILPLSFIWMVPNTLGWLLAFNSSEQSVPFKELFKARMAGESLNYLMPSGYLGGEPLKATLVAPYVGVPQGIASITIAKTTQTCALLIFVSAGLLVCGWNTEISPQIKSISIAVCSLLGTGVVVLFFASKYKILTRLMNWINSRKTNLSWLRKSSDKIHETSIFLADFYRHHTIRMMGSVLWHLVGWIMGTVEVYVISYLLGYPLNIVQSFIFSSITMLVTVGGFFIPGGLGAFELGHYLSASLVSIPPSVGISICILKRFRELFWILAGLVVLYFYNSKKIKYGAVPEVE